MKTIPSFNELIAKSDAQLYAMLEAAYASLAIASHYSADRRQALTMISTIRKAIRHRHMMRNRNHPVP